QHLATVRCSHHSRRPVHVEPNVLRWDRKRLASVDPDPHPEPALSIGQSLLRLLCSKNRVLRTREGDEERIALAINLIPVMTLKCFPKQSPMQIKRLRIPVATE